MDIVKRLRLRRAYTPEYNLHGEEIIGDEPDEGCQNAADEIERLRDCEAYNAKSVLWANNEIDRLRKALEWIAGCEGGDLFDLWKEMRDTARSALQRKDNK